MAKVKKTPPHTPDPLIKAAEAMAKDKRAGKFSEHIKGRSPHTWTDADTKAMGKKPKDH